MNDSKIIVALELIGQALYELVHGTSYNAAFPLDKLDILISDLKDDASKYDIKMLENRLDERASKG